MRICLMFALKDEIGKSLVVTACASLLIDFLFHSYKMLSLTPQIQPEFHKFQRRETTGFSLSLTKK